MPLEDAEATKRAPLSAGSPGPARPPSERQFRIYWIGQTLSGFGDAFALVALPLLVLDVTHSVSSMGLVSASGVIAQVATSLFSGTLVDRLDRRRLMIACDIGRAALYSLVPLYWMLAGPSALLLYLIAVVGGALANIFSVAYMTVVPALVSPDRLHSANARLQGSFALSYVLGSLAAGAICVHTGAAWALLIDATTFLASIASLFAIRFRLTTAERAAETHTGRFGAGLRFLLQHRTLRTITLLLIVMGLTGNIGIGAGVTDLMVFHLKRDLSLGNGVVGVCFGACALGALAGAASAPRVTGRIGMGVCFLCGSIVQGLGLLMIGLIPSGLAAGVGGFFWGAGMLMRGVPMHSLRQTAVPHALLGRVTAVSWIAVFSASAVGTTVVTRVAASAGAAATLAAIGIVISLVALAGASARAIRQPAGGGADSPGAGPEAPGGEGATASGPE